MVVVASCSERIVSPVAPATATSTRFASQTASAPSLNLSATSDGTVEFTVSQHGGTFLIGRNAVVFPRGSICDPTRSSYGVGTWDAACTPLNRAVSISAVVRVSGGRSWVDFSPALRFVPTTDPSRYVSLHMSTPGAQRSAQNPEQFTIYYAPTLGATLVDESISDPTLVTYVDSRTGVSTRRIKHFSGYTVMGLVASDTTAAAAH